MLASDQVAERGSARTCAKDHARLEREAEAASHLGSNLQLLLHGHLNEISREAKSSALHMCTPVVVLLALAQPRRLDLYRALLPAVSIFHVAPYFTRALTGSLEG